MLKNNTIYNLDCLIGMEKLKENSIDLTVTSPPYFNAKDYSNWDTYEEYLDWLKVVFTDVFRVTKVGRMVVVNISPVIEPRTSRSAESKRYAIPFHLVNIMETIGYKFIDDIIWKKPAPSVKNRNGGFYRSRKPVAYKPNIVTEYILVFQKPAPYLIDKILKNIDAEILEKSLVLEDYERTNIWEIAPIRSKEHPAVFPKELASKLITYYSFVGETVLDVFMGSGTTAVAAITKDRNYIGFEQDSNYWDYANKRTAIEIESKVVNDLK